MRNTSCSNDNEVAIELRSLEVFAVSNPKNGLAAKLIIQGQEATALPSLETTHMSHHQGFLIERRRSRTY